jgi:hypothetical protein
LFRLLEGRDDVGVPMVQVVPVVLVRAKGVTGQGEVVGRAGVEIRPKVRDDNLEDGGWIRAAGVHFGNGDGWSEEGFGAWAAGNAVLCLCVCVCVCVCVDGELCDDNDRTRKEEDKGIGMDQ